MYNAFGGIVSFRTSILKFTLDLCIRLLTVRTSTKYKSQFGQYKF